MKHILYCVPLVVATILSVSQPQERPVDSQQSSKTKLDAFTAQSGTVFIVGRAPIGIIENDNKTDALIVECRELINATTNQRQFGLVVEGDSSRGQRTAIDYEEIDSLISGIDYVLRQTRKSAHLAEFEAIYRTVGGLRISTFSDSSEKIQASVGGGLVTTWRVSCSVANLSDLRGLISQAKSKLDSIK